MNAQVDTDLIVKLTATLGKIGENVVALFDLQTATKELLDEKINALDERIKKLETFLGLKA